MSWNNRMFSDSVTVTSNSGTRIDRTHSDFADKFDDKIMGTLNTMLSVNNAVQIYVYCAVVYMAIGIAACVYGFDDDHYYSLKDDERNKNEPWYFLVIMGCGSVVPAATIVIDMLLGTSLMIKTMELSALFAGAMWIWCIVVMASKDSFKNIKQNYRPVSDVFWAYVIMYVFLGPMSVDSARTIKKVSKDTQDLITSTVSEV